MAKKKESLREALRMHKRGFLLTEKSNPHYFLAVGSSTVISSIIPFVTAFFSARLIDELAGARRQEEMWKWAWWLILSTFVLTTLWGLASRWKNSKMEPGAICSQRNLSDKLLALDYADIDKQSTQDLYSQVKQNEFWAGMGMWRLRNIFEEGLNALVGIISAITLTTGLFVLKVPEEAGALTILNHPLFLLGLAVLMFGLIVFNSMLFQKSGEYKVKWAEQSREMNRSIDAFTGIGNELSHAMDIRMYNQQEISSYYVEKDGISGKQKTYNGLAIGPMGLYMAASVGITVLLTGITYVFVCLKARAGAFGVGSVTLYVSSIVAVTAHISGLLRQITEMKNNTPFLRTIFEFLDIPNAMYQGSLTTEKQSDRNYEVEFRDVSFRYPGSDVWVLRHVSMKFNIGSRMAIVGENGSGKTTFIKLLCRLYDPQEGQILLNGMDIHKYNYRNYMNIFSIVFQDFKLLSQSLGSNVACAMEYDRERALKALQDAGFEERLANMPQGLDTILYRDLSPEGVEISGGEAQKIAIARALYKDAPFIILDEPTAALDPIAEAEIYSRFGQIVTDKTAVYISHRLSSCRFCDEILVFDEGHIVEKGTHEELVSAGGKYAELWNAQAQYYMKQG